MGSTTSCGLAEWAVMSDPDASNSTKGAVVGATSGASAGSFIGSLMGNGYYSSRNNSLIGAAVGAVAGAAIGSAIGSDMDKKLSKGSKMQAGTTMAVMNCMALKRNTPIAPALHAVATTAFTTHKAKPNSTVAQRRHSTVWRANSSTTQRRAPKSMVIPTILAPTISVAASRWSAPKW